MVYFVDLITTANNPPTRTKAAIEAASIGGIEGEAYFTPTERMAGSLVLADDIL